MSTHGLRFANYKTINPVCHSKFFPVSIDNFTVRLIRKDLTCSVIFYLGRGDRHYTPTPVSLPYNVNISLLSDQFTVQCNRLLKQLPTVPYMSIRYDKDVRQRLAKTKTYADDPNILILGLDSVSRMQFERMLPKTFAYINKDLDGIVLNGYNILGDGTPAQIIPILTGMQERELPSTLHRNQNGSFVDVYPFIWNQYRERGYVTGYAEDGPHMGIWTLRLRGFNRTPTDHYMTPFYRLKAAKSYLYGQNGYCFGEQTSYEFFLSYIRKFWSSYPTEKKFFFGFFKQYTHNGYRHGSLLDASILNMLQTLNKTGELERTIVIVMSDHGARFSVARLSSQGAIEERLPFMSFMLPPNFRRKYPNAINALRTNANRFTTPFDIHATLLSLFDMNKTTLSIKGDITQRNISLFKIIPAQRTCEHIRLPPHWCSCLQWKQVKINNPLIKRATEHIVNYINQNLAEAESLCRSLTLVSIRNAQMYKTTNQNISVSFERGVRKLSHWNRASDIIFYQITFETKPNSAIYEATTEYTQRTDSLYTDLSHISRLNAYKSSADCIVRKHSHLRKFCMCTK